jgi:hypothetical protein
MIESDTPDEGQLGQQINSRRQGLVDPIDHVSAFRSRNIISPDRLINLPPGMAVTVEIKTGSRRIIDYLLSPLLRYKLNVFVALKDEDFYSLRLTFQPGDQTDARSPHSPRRLGEDVEFIVTGRGPLTN